MALGKGSGVLYIIAIAIGEQKKVTRHCLYGRRDWSEHSLYLTWFAMAGKRGRGGEGAKKKFLSLCILIILILGR